MTGRRWVLGGRVQGVGFRPFVYRTACRHGLNGWVRNRGGQVEILAGGAPAALASFGAALLAEPPAGAHAALLVAEAAPPPPGNGFAVLPSCVDAAAAVQLSPDQAVCDDCLAELRDPADRRYRYPFVSCAQCGPRYTVVERLPWDRANTTLRPFVFCPACAAEYADPANRRFHAETTSCPDCGPQISFGAATGEAALQACLDALRAGAIVAVKGIGGYHLMCNAADAEAVARLRARKRRPHKPLAVMVGDAGLNRLVRCDPAAGALLRSPARPIVLLPRRADAPIAAGVAPDCGELGVLLPYSPLHHLLLDGFGAPLVATSGNRSGEPVLTDTAEAEARLGDVADAFLHHDRPIARPADDPVFRPIAGRPRPIRCGRGTAPLDLLLPRPLQRPTLALGGQGKVTVALGWDRRAVVSPHLGDMDTPRALALLARTVAELQALHGVRAEAVVCDAHPGYATTRFAATLGLPVRRVPHHRAHAAALAGELCQSAATPAGMRAGLADRPRAISEGYQPTAVDRDGQSPGLLGSAADTQDTGRWLVFTWDGTGYGEDGTLWGGEALLGHPGAWRLVASLRPFALPGGERAAQQPWRSALALCWEAGIAWTPPGRDIALLQHAWQRRLNCPVSSAAGRLFDAAAALLGLVETASHEGHAPMCLEAAALAHAVGDGRAPSCQPQDHGQPQCQGHSQSQPHGQTQSQPQGQSPGQPLGLRLSQQPFAQPLLGQPLALKLVCAEDGLHRTDWAPLLPLLLDPTRSTSHRAAAFHHALAGAIRDQAVAIRADQGAFRVGLTGGVFQNRVLAEHASAMLRADGFAVHLPTLLPCNDAALSYGQLVEVQPVEIAS